MITGMLFDFDCWACVSIDPEATFSLYLKLHILVTFVLFFITYMHVKMDSSPSGVGQHVPIPVFGGYRDRGVSEPG